MLPAVYSDEPAIFCASVPQLQASQAAPATASIIFEGTCINIQQLTLVLKPLHHQEIIFNAHASTKICLST